MRFVETPLDGLLVVEIEPITDARGFFARTYCGGEFGRRGLCTSWPQMNVSFNQAEGTLRGMHFQRAPHEEPKLVRCCRGAIWDVAVDVRRDSKTFGKWFGTRIDAEKRNALYIPAGFAHGFQTLTPESEVLYLMGETFHPELSDGLRWDDPALGIDWPIASPSLSARDAAYPDLRTRFPSGTGDAR